MTEHAVAKTNAASASDSDPDAVCATCHRDLYQRYKRTPMAQASGIAQAGFIRGEFTHEPSGVAYKVFAREDKVWMSFQRKNAAAHSENTLNGERELQYYIGSGQRGRTYLYQQQGLWFEAPINYYTSTHGWDMAPNYGQVRSMPAALPVDANCLHCHTTDVQPTLPTARNRFAAEPFAQGGLGCSVCHGDARAHAASGGRAHVLNPDKLTPVRRDSVCLQCHLEGSAAVYRTGTSLAAFKPGDDVFEHVAYFVKSAGDGSTLRAASQYEALLRSPCKAASGDRLTCTTCHNPHSVPAESERVAYYRAKCLACHTGAAIATQHHAEQPDCAACHMPTRSKTDISHEQATDHFIRVVSKHSPEEQTNSELLRLSPVGPEPAGDRELGLAYAQFAQYGNQGAARVALELLKHAEAQGESDAELHAQLGLMQQLYRNREAAQAEFRKALETNPNDPVALGNLAVLDASTGHLPEALHLLERVVQNDPAQTAMGMNLAFIECRLGQPAQALDLLQELRPFNPDDPTLSTFLATGSYGGQSCNLHAHGAAH